MDDLVNDEQITLGKNVILEVNPFVVPEGIEIICEADE